MELLRGKRRGEESGRCKGVGFYLGVLFLGDHKQEFRINFMYPFV